MSQEDRLGGDELVDALKALANPMRWQIMEWLRAPEVEFVAYEPIADRVEVGVWVSHIQAKGGLAQSSALPRPELRSRRWRLRGMR